jgi:N-acetylglucosaminyldiphosphoundecaprenol N-acetyl-beta-D-mannosaminyltransferase
MEGWIRARDRRAHAVFIVNAHTLNLASEDPEYLRILNSADVVFGDGTGVRLAARLKRVHLKDNLVGTDLIPELMNTTLDRAYRYFLLGGAPGTPERAVARLRSDYPGIRIAGHHHGFVSGPDSHAVVDLINASAADVLLVAMGNPLQERWIDDHRSELHVPVCVGVGGLFDHWAGNLKRAPVWVRTMGIEWTQILLQQPHKWRRYVLGNPKFVYRALMSVAQGSPSHGVTGNADGGGNGVACMHESEPPRHDAAKWTSAPTSERPSDR